MSEIEIRSFLAPAFGQNAYIVHRRGRADAVVVDPGAQHAAIRTALDAGGLETVAILLTHAHIDHVEGVPALQRHTGAPVWLHPDDLPLYEGAPRQAEYFGLDIEPLPPVNESFEHGQALELAGITFDVRHVPGHAPGHVILHIASAGAALVGDVIFQASIGRTDLPGGNFKQLIQGIREQVFTLPADTVLYPGHGPPTNVGHEQATNPFLIPHYGGRLA